MLGLGFKDTATHMKYLSHLITSGRQFELFIGVCNLRFDMLSDGSVKFGGDQRETNLRRFVLHTFGVKGNNLCFR